MSEHHYLLAIDQGTTGSTVLILDVSDKNRPEVLAKVTKEFKQYYPKPAWVEHDLDDIWESVSGSIEEACSLVEASNVNFTRKQIDGIGITNQRETLCLVDRQTRRPVYRAIVWQCKRSADICSRLKADGVEALLRDKTGLLIDPYFSGTKLTWVMENCPHIARRLKEKEVLVGTIDAWLISQLSQGVSFATEASNASRTLLFDIRNGDWDQELLDMLGVPSKDVLPEIKDSADIFATTKGLGFLPDGIPISGVLGDQQAALAGQACFDIGSGKCTYGTGAFLLVNQGDKPILSKNNLLTTVAWSVGGKLTYAFEGSAFIAGAALQFLRDQLGIIETATQSEGLATNVAAAPELYFVPALAGLGAPHWDPNARGAFLGLNRGTTNNQLIRAALEGVALQVCDLIEAIEADLGHKVERLRVDGGACANNLLMQSQSEFGGFEVDRPLNLETTAFGAAMMAGLGIGLYESLDNLNNTRKCDKLFLPTNSDEMLKYRNEVKAGWKRAIQAVQMFARN
ncbi:MAG: glycerol kinase [Bdellovibrionota bacterium]